MESLQQEVKQLRGDVETQAHALEVLKAARNQDSETGVTFPPPANPMMLPTIAAPVAPAAPVFPTTPSYSMPAYSAPTYSAPVTQPTTVAQPAVPIQSARPLAASGTEQSVYENAFSLLRSGGYSEAIAAFQNFLSTYPQSTLAGNAQYWIGEAYYTTRRFKEAMAVFQRAIDGYPGNPKAADALLKMGYIHAELNEAAEARKSLEEVISLYPQSTAAQLATNRLARLKR